MRSCTSRWAPSAGSPQRRVHEGGSSKLAYGTRCSRPLPATRKWPSLERSCAVYGMWPLARLIYERGPRPVQRNAAAPSNASSGATLNYSANDAATPSNASSGAAKVAT